MENNSSLDELQAERTGGSLPPLDLSSIPILADFIDFAFFDLYAEIPNDWWIAVADVKRSTEAIQAGRYKDVNLLGVTAIAAMLNAVKPLRIPFVFGGDGASFCIPPDTASVAREALASVRTLGREVFKLDLFIGLVPLSAIRAHGKRVLVASFRYSPTYLQFVFAGGGMSCAERLVKDPNESARYAIDEATTAADCSGLECRWNEISSPHGETVALLVQATGPNPEADGATYQAAIRAIHDAYGGAKRSHPVTLDKLQLGRGADAVRGEVAVHTHRLGVVNRVLYGLNVRVQQFIGRILMRTGRRFAGVDWKHYKSEVIDNTDRQKFDDTLRIVLSGTSVEREALETWLAEGYRSGALAYGLHVASSALMTCLIGDRSAGDHVHFVDAANGGYAMAAADLKRRLAPPQQTVE